MSFCTKCGTQRQTETAKFCATCGSAFMSVTQAASRNLCRNCGTDSGPQARKFCANCGVTLVGAPAAAPHDTPAALRLQPSYLSPEETRARLRYGRQGGKSKTTAVLLAIFLGGWTWVYTYREDGSKFWIATAANVINFFIARADPAWYVVAIPVSIGFYIWGIVNAANRTSNWYADYNIGS